MKSISPGSGLKMTLAQAALGILFVVGVGYWGGVVHAQQMAHERQEGHPAIVKRVRQSEITLAKVAAILERMEKLGQ